MPEPLPQVRTIKEIEKLDRLFVDAVCPKCKKPITSLTKNAINIVTKGCQDCTKETKDAWLPKDMPYTEMHGIEMMKRKKKKKWWKFWKR